MVTIKVNWINNLKIVFFRFWKVWWWSLSRQLVLSGFFLSFFSLKFKLETWKLHPSTPTSFLALFVWLKCMGAVELLHYLLLQWYWCMHVIDGEQSNPFCRAKSKLTKHLFSYKSFKLSNCRDSLMIGRKFANWPYPPASKKGVSRRNFNM